MHVCTRDSQVVNLFSVNLIDLEQMTVRRITLKPHRQLFTFCPLETKKPKKTGTVLCGGNADLFPGLRQNWKW